MMMKSAERVEGKQGKRTAPGVRPHPHVSRWWLPISSEVVGVSPSAEAQHLRSNSDKANARAAVHAMRTLHLRNQATIADFRTTSGSHLAVASARALRKLLASVDHLPPTSQPSTTNLARPMSPASSGYVLSLRPSCLQQCSSVGHSALSPGCSVPADGKNHRGVCGQLRSLEQGGAINYDLQTAVVNLSEWEKVHLLHFDVHGHSSACLSANPCRCAFQSKPPASQNPRHRTSCAMVATRV